MILLDGKKLSQEIKSEIKEEVNLLIEKGLRAPHLVTVLVGDNKASQAYVKSKIRSCNEVGFRSTNIKLDSNTAKEELLNVVEKLNLDDEVDGFIVQLPLPAGIDENEIINAIDPSKDVDGFHPLNLGKLVIGTDTMIPATPLGILEIFRRYDLETIGKDVAVLGRSNIVGKPIAICLMQKLKTGNATVTVLHSRTKDLASRLRSADIIIAAVGSAEFVTADMVRDNAIVIDVGINSVPSDNEKGYRITGDVDFKNVAPKCSYITPVPGGVGLMTVASLLINTFKAYKKRYGIT
jgi:methylenetetrahydrofolate dehydrogenase (NADP+)/methenyltetrahydrofolate cyclohydrolase